jgi:predicted transcriptional regulator
VELCFEILARHNSMKYPNLLIKVVENIDSVRPHFLAELKIVSRILEALPIIVGMNNRHGELENGCIYLRNGLIALNLPTLMKIVEEPTLPLAIAKQGGFFYEIDGEKIERLRERQGYSRKELAEKLNLSSKAISQYENKGMRASYENATAMKDILGDSVIVPLDFYSFLKDSLGALKLNDRLQRKITKRTEEFMKEINEIVADTGYKVYWTRSAPFDMFVYEDLEDDSSQIKYQFVGGTQIEKKSKDIKAKLKRNFIPEISFHQVDGAIIYNKEIYNEKSARKYRVPYLFPEELRELEDIKRFKRILRERSKYQS